jgi:hypothetical protein
MRADSAAGRQVALTTHTFFGGERTRDLTRYDVQVRVTAPAGLRDVGG